MHGGVCEEGQNQVHAAVVSESLEPWDTESMILSKMGDGNSPIKGSEKQIN